MANNKRQKGEKMKYLSLVLPILLLALIIYATLKKVKIYVKNMRTVFGFAIVALA